MLFLNLAKQWLTSGFRVTWRSLLKFMVSELRFFSHWIFKATESQDCWLKHRLFIWTRTNAGTKRVWQEFLCIKNPWRTGYPNQHWGSPRLGMSRESQINQWRWARKWGNKWRALTCSWGLWPDKAKGKATPPDDNSSFSSPNPKMFTIPAALLGK